MRFIVIVYVFFTVVNLHVILYLTAGVLLYKYLCMFIWTFTGTLLFLHH
jgi:hypothetical protein